jgi:hypothetical protein
MVKPRKLPAKALLCSPELEYVENMCRVFNPPAFLGMLVQNQLSKEYKYRLYGTTDYMEALQMLNKCNFDGQPLEGEISHQFFDLLIIDFKKQSGKKFDGFDLIEQVQFLGLDQDLFVKERELAREFSRPGVRVIALVDEKQKTLELMERLLETHCVVKVLPALCPVKQLDYEISKILDKASGKTSSVAIEKRIDKDYSKEKKSISYRELLRWRDREGKSKSTALRTIFFSDALTQSRILQSTKKTNVDQLEAEELHEIFPPSFWREYSLALIRKD